MFPIHSRWCHWSNFPSLLGCWSGLLADLEHQLLSSSAMPRQTLPCGLPASFLAIKSSCICWRSVYCVFLVLLAHLQAAVVFAYVSRTSHWQSGAHLLSTLCCVILSSPLPSLGLSVMGISLDQINDFLSSHYIDSIFEKLLSDLHLRNETLKQLDGKLLKKGCPSRVQL